ncbi:steroid 17-alpha-hydroxylase/17,20 lyase isoform X2 [Sceloporus undulatus]|nr:steroid 17-alpha-hydroxylase/17,20 lyase isoform X2 [Sceloporus undulatus]XP_042313567.1 steroid 17-alpha-hydroxylase/17,20 lyase isoform X2 [Sceloporus undulatus]XP_042313568.1 steroid 17-alpha-hydroxylase/17,20 lyase isoform X2 [Sceloporus undulatus]
MSKVKLKCKRNYPKSLPSLPLIGSLLHFVGDTKPHLLFCRLQQRYGSLYSLYMGSDYVVVVNSYLHAKEVLLKKGKIFAGRPRTVTTDLLTRNGKDIAFASYSPFWKYQRKLVHSALCMFGEGSLALEKIICQEASSLCETLSAALDSPLDMSPELTRAVTNVVCSLCFNSSYQRGDPEFEAMLKYSQGIVDTVAKQGMVDIFPWLQFFPNKELTLLRKCVEMRDQLLQQKFEKHKEEFSNDSVSDLIDALLRAKLNMENNNSHILSGQGLTDDYLLMTVADIFGAGVETTTTVLKWTVLYLLHYPEVQQKIQEELDQKLGFNRHPLLKDRQHLPYLEATISEVLRIRPVSPLLIPHEALQDTSIGEYDIPKGAQVVINLWSIHHDEKEWEKPEEFSPDRFLDEDGNRIYTPSPSYLPFGAGVRVCLGEALAKMELFLFMAWILQRFTLSVPEGQTLPDPEGKFGVVLQVPKFKVKASLRKAWEKK